VEDSGRMAMAGHELHADGAEAGLGAAQSVGQVNAD